MSTFERSPFELIRKHWPWIFGATLLGVIAISLVHGFAEAHLAHRDKVSSKVATIGDSSKKGLTGLTWVEPLPVRLHQLVYWRIELRNTLDQSIRVSIEELWHSGLGPEESSGNSAVVRSTRTGSSRVWTQWSRTLEPGEEAAIWTQWRAWKPRALGLSALLSWQSEEDPEIQGTVVASLHDIHVMTPWRTFWAYAVKCFVGLLGVLTVPVILAAAGFWFQEHQKVVEQERQEEQAQIDRKRQTKQAEIDHKRQIWSKMLPTSHDLNMKYYIPLKSTITTLQRDYGRYRAATPDTGGEEEALTSAFHYLLITLRQFRLITTEAGGFYFKSRDGERLFTDLINQFNFQVLLVLRPYEALSAVLDVIDPKDTVSTFEQKLSEQEALREIHGDLRESFRDWIKGDRQWAFSILFTAKLLLGYEVNSVYTDWYEEPERWPEEMDGLLKDWRRQDESETTKQLLCRIEEYGRDEQSDPQDGGRQPPSLGGGAGSLNLGDLGSHDV